MLKTAAFSASLITFCLVLGQASANAAPDRKALQELKAAAGPVSDIPHLPLSEAPATKVEAKITDPVYEDTVHPSAGCYALAREKLKISVWGAVMLCSGTPSAEAPVACFGEARSRLSDLGSVLLCTGAASTQAPSECYDKARKLNLTALGAATLCHAADVADARIACFNESRKFLNVTGAVELCGRLPFELYNEIYGKKEDNAALAEK